jgi:hypothetical protein
MPETAAPERLDLTETIQAAIREAPQASGGSLLLDVQIIEAGWNSSGQKYYGTDVLARDVPRVFPKGTHCYVDHPTMTEKSERPERSLRDLAAVFTADPRTDDGGRTWRAPARVFGPYAEMLREAWQDIGLSINAHGVGEWGEREGRQGMIVTEIAEGYSVDFVTRAGAGGKVLALLESARRMNLVEAGSLGSWLESRLHLTLTQLADDMYGDGRLTRDERITLSAAIGDGLKAWTARVEREAGQLFARAVYEDAPAAVSVPFVAGESATPTPPADPPPVPGGDQTDGAPPADTTPTEIGGAVTAPTTGPAPGDQAGTTTTPTPAVDLTEAARRLTETQQALAAEQAALVEARAAADRLAAENAQLLAGETARTRISAMLAESSVDERLRPLVAPRVTAAIVGRVPLTENRAVDTTALDTAITAAIEAESTFAAQLLEAQGVGRPRDLGAGTTPQPQGDGESAADFEAYLTESFAGLGLSEAAAKIAAKGRV